MNVVPSNDGDGGRTLIAHRAADNGSRCDQKSCRAPQPSYHSIESWSYTPQGGFVLRAVRQTATFVVALLALFVLNPTAQAAPTVQLGTSLSIQATPEGREIGVKGRLVDVRDRAIPGAQLKVRLDALSLGIVTTDEGGRWATTVTIPASLGAGRHDIIVVFDGTDQYKATAGSVAVTIGDQTTPGPEQPATEPPGLKPTTLTASVPAEPQLWGTVVSVTGNLTGPEGAQIGGAPITVNGPGGIRSDCLTDDGGAYACEMAVPDVEGPVELEAVFASMQGFAAASARATLQVVAPATPTAGATPTQAPTPSTTPKELSSAEPQSEQASASSSTVAVTPAPAAQSTYGPLLIALVGAFAVLGLGVLGLSLMRSSRREPVERFIEPSDAADDAGFIDDEPPLPIWDDEPAAPLHDGAGTSAGHRYGASIRPADPRAPRRALD